MSIPEPLHVLGFITHRAVVRAANPTTGICFVEIPEWTGANEMIEVSNIGLSVVMGVYNVPAVGSSVFVASNRVLNRAFFVSEPYNGSAVAALSVSASASAGALQTSYNSAAASIGVLNSTDISTAASIGVLNAAYISTSASVGVLNATYNPTATPTFASITLNAATGAKVTMSGATSNWLQWNSNGVAAPAFTTRSVGTKIVLYPTLTGSAADYAIGIDSGTLWSSVPDSASFFKWYGGTTVAATLTSAGALTTTGAVSATSFTASAMSTFTATGETVKMTGGNPYISMWNTGATTRTGYLQGVVGSDVRLVADSGSPNILIGAGTVSIRDGTLGTIRTTVDSSGLTVNSGALTVTSGNVTLSSGNVIVNAGTAATSGTIKSGGGYLGTANGTGGSFTLTGNGPAFLTDSGANWYHADWTGGVLKFYVDSTNVKNFTIQHPTDADRWLVHACVEGPTSDVFYRGQGTLVGGQCSVTLPSYFESIAELSGRTVQLTSICRTAGSPSANLASSPVVNGAFTVSLCSGSIVEDQEFFWRVDAVRVGTSFPVEPLKSDVTIAGFGPYTYIS